MPRADRAGGAADAPALVQRRQQDGVYVVTVCGEIDISNIAELREVAFDMPNDALGLVLDLNGTTFIDSATIGMLFELRQALRRRCQALRVLCTPGSTPRQVLELMSFDGGALSEESAAVAVAGIRAELPLND